MIRSEDYRGIDETLELLNENSSDQMAICMLRSTYSAKDKLITWDSQLEKAKHRLDPKLLIGLV
jgi:hypothetical protein